MDSLATVRMIFIREKIAPPVAIILESHEDGMRFVDAVRRANLWPPLSSAAPDVVSPCVGGNDSPCLELNVHGIVVRWPAYLPVDQP